MLTRLQSILLFAPVLFAADLPVRQVILYKHGVGFFERSGSLAAGESTRLDFQASEMNDVLKSLVISGEGASVAGLRYDSGVALDRRLGDFPFRIDGAQPLSGVLDQLKGARVEMQTANEKIAGLIVAARSHSGDKDHPERQQLVLLLDSGDMRTFDLDAALSIRFTDPKLQSQFRDYLGALTAARSKEKRSLYIDGKVSGGRDISASYIIPAPIWKSSYRLRFGDNAEPVLEGWAIVDNTTTEDWKDVQMALVSGKPISFISELYLPRFISRQAADLPEEAAMRPELHDPGMVAQTVEVQAAAAPVPGVLGGVIGGIPQTSQDQLTSDVRFKTANRQAAQMATAPGSDLADLFEYRIAQPVTIKSNESAMLPFLQDKIKARKIILYTDAAASHPLSAAELTNSTLKTLDGGPITVYDGGTYVGEALVETVKAGDKRLISYGVDLGTRITNGIGAEYDTEVREMHARDGVLIQKSATIQRTTYTIHNADTKAKTLILEHPFETGYKVLNQKPSETTANRWRFEIKLGPSANVTFPIVQERENESQIVISQLTPDVLVEYTRNKRLSDAGRAELQRLVDLKRKIADANASVQAAQAKTHAAEADESRVRQNLDSLNRISGQAELVQKYSNQLAQLETGIAESRDQEAAAREKARALQAQLDDLIAKAAF